MITLIFTIFESFSSSFLPMLIVDMAWPTHEYTKL
jgi:hypothetical protein